MPLNRRALLLSSPALLGASSLFAQAALTSAYPNQPIKFVVPYPAGGATDALARLVAQKMSDKWGVPVTVDNKPGAGGTIGANIVAKGQTDGYQVLFSIVALVQQIKLMKLPYDPMTDFAPITRVAVSPSIFAVAPTVPANTLDEFIKLVKANPNKYNYGTYGAGTSSHLQGSLLNMQAGLDLQHIPYSGGAPLVNAMLGGQLFSAFMDAGSSKPHLPKFKLLGVTGTQRISWLPNVPTLKEQGLNSYEPMGWFGMFMPAKTPANVVEAFSAESRRVLALPDVKEKIESMGLFPSNDSRAEFVEVLKRDAAVYARIVTDAKITLE